MRRVLQGSRVYGIERLKFFSRPLTRMNIRRKYFELLQLRKGVITALNTQRNQAYLRMGAINKLQFQ